MPDKVRIALDSPPEGISLREANLALLGTGLGAAMVLAALVWLASLLRRDWQRIGARILALQLRYRKSSESMGNHDSKIVDAGSVD